MTSPDSRRTALIVVTLASFLTPFMGSAVNVALPSMGVEFALDAVTLGWISTAYLLGVAASLVPLGRLGDIHGRKRIFTLGAFLFSITSLAIALAPSSSVLISLRVLQGISGAMIFSTGVAILTSIYPANEKGRVLGFNTAAVYTGLSLGPTLGGVLTQHFGWRSIFGVITVLALATALLTLWKLQGEWAEARGDTFDIVGSCGIRSVVGERHVRLLVAAGGAWLRADYRWSDRLWRLHCVGNAIEQPRAQRAAIPQQYGFHLLQCRGADQLQRYLGDSFPPQSLLAEYPGARSANGGSDPDCAAGYPGAVLAVERQVVGHD